MLEIVDSKESKSDALTIARQIFDQFAKVKTILEDDDELEEVANTEEIDDKDDGDTNAAEVEEKDNEHVGQDNAREVWRAYLTRGRPKMSWTARTMTKKT